MFNQLGAIPLSTDILEKANIGLWAFELDEGKEPRMYVDNAMLKLIGLDHQVSPEETYHAWYDHIDKDSYELVSDAVEKMIAGEHAEVQYPWHHPNGQTYIVRCGGVRNPKYTNGVRIEGTHQNVTEVIHFDEEKQNNETKELMLRVISSLTVNYSLLYFIDSDTAEYRLLKKDQEFADKIENNINIKNNFFDDCKNNSLAFIYKDDIEKFKLVCDKNTFEKTFNGGNTFTIEYRTLIDNQPFWYGFTATKIYQNDKLYYAVGISKIEHQRRLQQKYLESVALADYFFRTYDAVYYVNISSKRWVINKNTDRVIQNYTINQDYRIVISDYMRKVVHPDDIELFSVLLYEDEIKARLENRNSFSFVYRVLDKKEEIYARCEVIKGADIEHVAMGFTNITEEFKEQKRKLLGAIPLSSDILTKARIGLWAFELDEGKEPRMYADEAMLKLIGLERVTSPEDTYHAWYDYIDKNSYGLVKDAVDKMIAGEHAEVQYPWHHPNGHTMIVRCGGVRNPNYTDGIRIEGTHQDVTETIHYDEEETKRKFEKETALANQQRQLKSFGDMVNAALWSIKLNDNDEPIEVTWSNDFRRMLGFDENVEDFPNDIDAWASRLYEDDKENTIIHLKESFSSKNYDGFAYDIEYRMVRKNGEVRWYHAVGRMECVEEGFRRMYGIFFDITADKKLEEALKQAQAANIAKTTFLFNMSHDIRTPMNAIVGFTNMAKKYCDDKEKLLDCLDKTQQANNLLLSLINSVLELSRIEAGKAELEESPGDVRLAFENIKTTVDKLAKEKNISIDFEITDILDYYIYCDFDRSTRIFMNIISNAIKYTNEGGWIKVKCIQTSKDENYGYYRYTFEDNGIGMSDEFQKRLFDEFARENNTTISGVQGFGIGLSVVKSLVELMNGKIDVESKKGIGTKFIVDLPFRLQKDNDAKYVDINTKNIVSVNQDNNEDVKKYLENKKVLLVEDNELNRIIANSILCDVKLIVDEVDDGIKAVERLKEKGPDYYDFILMDIQMPIMNGYEATKEIRTMYPNSKLPIIALSANAFAEDKQASLDAGMNDHIAKPINTYELYNALIKFIK